MKKLINIIIFIIIAFLFTFIVFYIQTGAFFSNAKPITTVVNWKNHTPQLTTDTARIFADNILILCNDTLHSTCLLYTSPSPRD